MLPPTQTEKLNFSKLLHHLHLYLRQIKLNFIHKMVETASGFSLRQMKAEKYQIFQKTLVSGLLFERKKNLWCSANNIITQVRYFLIPLFMRLEIGETCEKKKLQEKRSTFEPFKKSGMRAIIEFGRDTIKLSPFDFRLNGISLSEWGKTIPYVLNRSVGESRNLQFAIPFKRILNWCFLLMWWAPETSQLLKWVIKKLL